MPLTHLRTFRVRYYECDAFKRLNHTNYLRYMQEAAFDASAAAGYGLARYEAMERLWLVRETDIEYMRPLRYGDRVQVKTWVADFGRVRSRRDYEFRLAGSGEMAARAYTDWAFLDSRTGRPARIPADMVAAFFPEGLPEAPPARPRFPALPPATPGVFRERRRVEWRDIDTAQHVNNTVYMAYVEDCELRALAAHGWPLSRLRAGEGMPLARRQQIEYREPALLDDELEVAAWLSGVEGTTGAWNYTITRVGDGALLAQARTGWEWVETRWAESPAGERPAPIPAGFLDDMAPITSGA
jgi:acyl-CoA thioester hydrolase